MFTVPVREKDFEQEVLHKRGSVLVGFHAAGCIPCKTLISAVKTLSVRHPELAIASVDIHKSPALAQRYQILTLPTLLLFRNGRLTARAVGAKTTSALEEMIK